MIVFYCQSNLNEIKKLLQQLDAQHYQQPCVLLSNSSIGQHVRHVLEFYKELITGLPQGIVNYDNRQRDVLLETDPNFAQQLIAEINLFLASKNSNQTLFLEGNYSDENEKNTTIETSLYRELAYCLEHSIHHQAFIKVSLIDQNISYMIDNDFGLAPATIRHYKHSLAK